MTTWILKSAKDILTKTALLKNKKTKTAPRLAVVFGGAGSNPDELGQIPLSWLLSQDGIFDPLYNLFVLRLCLFLEICVFGWNQQLSIRQERHVRGANNAHKLDMNNIDSWLFLRRSSIHWGFNWKQKTVFTNGSNYWNRQIHRVEPPYSRSFDPAHHGSSVFGNGIVTWAINRLGLYSGLFLEICVFLWNQQVWDFMTT